MFVYFDNDTKVHAPFDARVLTERVARLLAPTRSRSRTSRGHAGTNFWIFPVEVFGSSRNTKLFGTLKRAMCSRQKVAELFLGHGGTRLQLDECTRRLAPLLVGLRHHSGAQNGGMAV